MYICIYVYMYICIYVYMYICIYVYMYMYIYVCMYIYVYMYVCIYVYMHICKHLAQWFSLPCRPLPSCSPFPIGGARGVGNSWNLPRPPRSARGGGIGCRVGTGSARSGVGSRFGCGNCGGGGAASTSHAAMKSERTPPVPEASLPCICACI